MKPSAFVVKVQVKEVDDGGARISSTKVVVEDNDAY